MHVIEVLGPGCRNCQSTERVVRDAVAATGIAADIRHVTDEREIVGRGVLSTPGVVVDGVVVSVGRVPTIAQVEGWLRAGPD
jgi:small redox-active disulfide protein 2